MKATLAEIMVAQQALLKLDKLPGKVAYRLGVLAADLGDQVDVMNKVRNDLIRKHGTPDESGQPVIKANTPEMKQFSEEWAEVLEQEIEIKLDQKIQLPGDIQVEPMTLFQLRNFVEVI